MLRSKSLCNRQRQGEATSDIALLVRLTTCRMREACALQNLMHVAVMKAHFVDKEVPKRFGFAPLRVAKVHVFERTDQVDWSVFVFWLGRL